MRHHDLRNRSRAGRGWALANRNFPHYPASLPVGRHAKKLLHGHRSWHSAFWRIVWSTENPSLPWMRSLQTKASRVFTRRATNFFYG